MSLDNFSPTGSRYLVRRVDTNQRMTQSGLHIPANALEDQVVGEIVAVGPGALSADGSRETMRGCVGERVFYSDDECQELGDGLFIVAQQNCLGTIEAL